MPPQPPKAGRNEICPCGSGKKYKRCCGSIDLAKEDTASRFFGVAAVLAGLMAVGGVVVFAMAFFSEDEGSRKVWSAEHGHYHTVGGGEQHGSTEGGPGKVWSEEHGHYHDAAKPEVPVGKETPVTGALQGLRNSQLDQAGKQASDPTN